MPDYEVKGPDGNAVPVFWKDPDEYPLIDSVHTPAVEIYLDKDAKKRGQKALVVDGVDILGELERTRWFATVGYVMAGSSIALALAALVFIFLAHS